MPKRPAPEPTEPLPSTLDQLDIELTRLGEERASLIDADRATPAAERRLLERNAPEAEFHALAIRQKRIRHQLEQLDERESVLLRHATELGCDARIHAWATFVDRFAVVAEQARQAADTLLASHRAIQALHIEAARAGFNRRQSGAELPTLPLHTGQYTAVAALSATVASLRTMSPAPVERVASALVRITRFTIVRVGLHSIGHNRGECVGLPPELAWQLVDEDRADWLDPRRIPPRPPTRRRRRATETA